MLMAWRRLRLPVVGVSFRSGRVSVEAPWPIDLPAAPSPPFGGTTLAGSSEPVGLRSVHLWPSILREPLTTFPSSRVVRMLEVWGPAFSRYLFHHPPRLPGAGTTPSPAARSVSCFTTAVFPQSITPAPPGLSLVRAHACSFEGLRPCAGVRAVHGYKRYSCLGQGNSNVWRYVPACRCRRRRPALFRLVFSLPVGPLLMAFTQGCTQKTNCSRANASGWAPRLCSLTGLGSRQPRVGA